MRRAFTALLATAAVWLGLTAAALAQGQAIAGFVAALSTASAPIAITTATTTKLIANGGKLNPAGGAQAIHVTALDLLWAGTGNIQFVSGTTVTTPCDTGQATVSGNYHGIAQTALAKGSGFGAVWILPAGADLCAVTSANVEIDGSLAYGIF